MFPDPSHQILCNRNGIHPKTGFPDTKKLMQDFLLFRPVTTVENIFLLSAHHTLEEEATLRHTKRDRTKRNPLTN